MHRAPSCVSVSAQSRTMAHGCRRVGRARLVTSRACPLNGICVARFLCIVRSAQASPNYTCDRRAHTATDDSRHTTRDRRPHTTRPREGTTTPQVTDSTLLHTRHNDGKGRSGGGGGSGARAEQRPPRWSLLRAGARRRRLCAGSRVRPGGKAQAPWWRRRETRRWPAVAETRAFRTPRSGR